MVHPRSCAVPRGLCYDRLRSGDEREKILAFLAFSGWGNSDTRTGKKRGLGSGFADQEVWKVSQDQKERGESHRWLWKRPQAEG